MNNKQHPLPLNTYITATRKICPCKGGGTSLISGSIAKIISNQSGVWYYLNTGVTVNSNDVQ